MSEAAIVIGAGANELVAAHMLARQGLRVIALAERAVADDAFEAGWIPREVARAVGADWPGLDETQRDPWIASALPDGGRLELYRDMARSVEAIRKLSASDAAKWPAFCERMGRLARLLETLYVQPPPDLLGEGAGNLLRLARLGLRIRGLGRQGMEDLLRLAPMPVADFLDDWFESDALKGVLGAAGVMNLCMGSRSGGTAFRLLHHHVGSPPGVFRPPRSNLRQVLAMRSGVELRHAAEVARIAIRDGRVSGVVLVNGEEIAASVVVSGADPQRTLLALADPSWLDPELVRAVRNIRARGVAARVTLAFDRAPGFATLAVAPSLDYLERAYDDAKHGRVSAAPYLEARNIGAPADGRHRVEVHAQYAPYSLAGGVWDDDRRRALGELVLRTLAVHAPAAGSAGLESVLAPCDLEDRYGYPQGQAEHAEPALDQLLWMRPVPELAGYRTPIEGLYLCGAGMHPGGSVAGAAGYNAARAVLNDRKNS